MSVEIKPISAVAVQESMLKVSDNVVIAHGYTTRRESVEIFFRGGYLVRRMRNDRYSEQLSVYFIPDFFFNDMKRWYRDGVNPLLAQVFATFDRFGLDLTDGGTPWGYAIED